MKQFTSDKSRIQDISDIFRGRNFCMQCDNLHCLQCSFPDIHQRCNERKMKVVHNKKYPSGCIMDFAKKRGRFNTAESDADAGVRYINVFSSKRSKRRMDGMRRKVDVGQSLSRSIFEKTLLETNMAFAPENGWLED